MSPTEIAAEAMVRAYLNGRKLPPILHSAVVWVADARLICGERPVLDKALCRHIDGKAVSPIQSKYDSPARSMQPAICALLTAGQGVPETS